MRLLAGDVGGTKTLLRCVDGEGRLLLEGRYDTAGYVRFDDVVRAFLHDLGTSVDAACFAVAGPVEHGHGELTNRGWVVDRQALEISFQIPRVSIINDFYAVAMGVPLLGPRDVVPIKSGQRDRTAPVAILGAGTGLGQAIVIFRDGVHHVVPTEGGHGDFAPQDEEQTRLFLFLHRQLGHVSWERLLSGMGLVNIFTFLGGAECDPAEISEQADRGDPIARRTMEIFADIYGAEAGNMALRVLSHGGVFLAGGIAAKNLPWMTDGRFVEAFLRKGRFRDFMERVPVDVIANEEVGLIGAMECTRRLVGRL